MVFTWKIWPKVKTGKYPGYLPLGIYLKVFTRTLGLTVARKTFGRQLQTSKRWTLRWHGNRHPDPDGRAHDASHRSPNSAEEGVSSRHCISASCQHGSKWSLPRPTDGSIMQHGTISRRHAVSCHLWYQAALRLLPGHMQSRDSNHRSTVAHHRPLTYLSCKWTWRWCCDVA